MDLTKKKYLFFAGVAIMAIMATIAWNKNLGIKSKSDIPEPLAETKSLENLSTNEKTSFPTNTTSQSTSVSVVEKTNTESEQVTMLKNLNHSLVEMSSCLSLSEPGPISANENPVLGFLDTLKPELGEAVYQNLQWSNTSVRLPNGDQRRIRIETENNDEMSTQSIKLFSLDQEGYPVLIPLSPEQTKNPTQTFIASLENSGEIIKQEKAERLIFQNGEDLHLVQLNGQLKEFEISRNSKSFKCEGLVDSQPNCVCL